MSRITSQTDPDEPILTNLRAQSWQEFFGQSRIKQALLMALEAAAQRKEPVDHTLLYGPPGLGKTTLAHLMARTMESNLKISTGPTLSKTGDLAAILTNLKPNDVLFIDEIHRLRKPIEELLYSAMEDFALDIVIGKGPSARTVRLDIPPFTLVGATTKFGSLSQPLRDRFGMAHRLNHYQPEELIEIIVEGGRKLDITMPKTSALVIAQRSRGTPRVALKLLRRVRDYVQLEKINHVNEQTISAALDIHAIDPQGLNEIDRKYLHSLEQTHQGGPVGLTTLAATLQEDPVTIEEVIEPYLLQLGLIKKTKQGRVSGRESVKS